MEDCTVETESGKKKIVCLACSKRLKARDETGLWNHCSASECVSKDVLHEWMQEWKSTEESKKDEKKKDKKTMEPQPPNYPPPGYETPRRSTEVRSVPKAPQKKNIHSDHMERFRTPLKLKSRSPTPDSRSASEQAEEEKRPRVNLESRASHYPFRSWCQACVRGKAKAMSHFRVSHDEEQVPIVTVDYCFMNSTSELVITDELQQKHSPILVVRDRLHEKSVCPCISNCITYKGTAKGPIGSKCLLNDLKKLDYPKVIVRHDPEPALSLVEATKNGFEGSLIIEKFPKGVKESKKARSKE